MGGVLAVTLGWPIAQAAWQAQRADGVFYAGASVVWIVALASPR